MEALQTAGLVKSIGVSNFKIDDLKTLLHKAKVHPAVNQILLHPYVYENTKDLLAFMKEHVSPFSTYHWNRSTYEPSGKRWSLVNT